jgi:regulator of sirC expression with transglutaminase-like and TPR domain
MVVIRELGIMATLRDSDRQALVKLLSDDDATVLQLLEERFLEMGSDGLAFLETVARDAAPDARRGARRILHTIHERDVFETFAQFCATCGTAFDLETGCWLLAKTRYPELDTVAYQARLDQMARELKERLTGRETPRATIEVCNRYFFRRLGFRGNEEDYYDPDNSYLNRVLDRRLGIPISLSVVYYLTGRRLGLPLHGVNLPGHFLLKWRSARNEFFVDAFNEGQVLHDDDCREMCEQMGQRFRPGHLAPATSRQILLRLCRNLQAIYLERDEARAEQFGRFIALLSRT